MTEINNRIEEVKKILIEVVKAARVDKAGFGIDWHELAIFDKFARQICQLFPQPLDDKELPKNPYGEASKTNPKVLLSDFPQQYEAYNRAQKDMVALLQPKIEEARKQERERISKWGSDACVEHYKRGMGFHKKRRECRECWQALKGGERE